MNEQQGEKEGGEEKGASGERRRERRTEKGITGCWHTTVEDVREIVFERTSEVGGLDASPLSASHCLLRPHWHE